MYVKICGTTTPEDAELAVTAGADALGFIFAPSPRRVTAAQAAAMPTPGHVQRVGILVAPEFQEALAALRDSRLHALQLHDTAPQVAQALRAKLPRPSPDEPPRLIGVLHFTPGTTEAAFLATLQQAAALYDAVLLDSRTATAAGGTGIPFDWTAASHALARSPTELPRLIVAGGLHPDNVADAIRLLQPWGVDVVTGVESSPGRKDAARLHAFLTAVRALASD